MLEGLVKRGPAERNALDFTTLAGPVARPEEDVAGLRGSVGRGGVDRRRRRERQPPLEMPSCGTRPSCGQPKQGDDAEKEASAKKLARSS